MKHTMVPEIQPTDNKNPTKRMGVDPGSSSSHSVSLITAFKSSERFKFALVSIAPPWAHMESSRQEKRSWQL